MVVRYFITPTASQNGVVDAIQKFGTKNIINYGEFFIVSGNYGIKCFYIPPVIKVKNIFYKLFCRIHAVCFV